MQALIRRKVRVVDKGEILQIKVPFPLPLSWGRTVAPFAPHGIRKVPKPPAAGNADKDGADDSAAEEAAGSFLQVAGIAGTHLVTRLKQDFQVQQITILTPSCEIL